MLTTRTAIPRIASTAPTYGPCFIPGRWGLAGHARLIMPASLLIAGRAILHAANDVHALGQDLRHLIAERADIVGFRGQGKNPYVLLQLWSRQARSSARSDPVSFRFCIIPAMY